MNDFLLALRTPNEVCDIVRRILLVAEILAYESDSESFLSSMKWLNSELTALYPAATA